MVNLKSFPLSDSVCASVSQDSQGVQLTFNNGLSISLKLSSVSVNPVQSLSWLTCNLALANASYANAIQGLMGNLDGLASNDLVRRDTGSVPANLTSERSVYQVASTWALTPNDQDLFRVAVTKRRGNSRITIGGYTPTFLEDLPINPGITQQCGSNMQCVLDALISGLPAVGKDTGNQVANAQKTSIVNSM